MARKSKITELEISNLIQDYQNSQILFKDLAHKYGRKPSTIREIFRKRGIKIEYNRNRKVSSNIKKLILNEYKKDISMFDIASKFQISHGTVCNIIHSNIGRQKEIKPRRKSLKYYSNEDLLKLITDYYKKYNIIPGCRLAYKDKELPSPNTYYKRFKLSWGKILELAGLDISKYNEGKDNILYDSIEEKEIANILYSNFIQYEPHKILCENRKWTCDFYLPDQKLWIEYDGLEEQRRHPDKFAEKIQYYKDNQLNYIILTRKDNILEKLNLKINHNYRFSIKEIDKTTSDNFLSHVHYLKGSSRRDSIRLGFYYQNILVSVITFGKVANPKEKSLCLNRCAVIDRIRLSHPYNNVTSYIISKSLKWIKKNGHRGKIVSWSDPRFHSGTLYKACNFQLINNKMKSDYIYVDINGNEYHKSKCRVPAGQSESQYAKSLGLTKTIIPAKQRWEFNLSV